MTFELFAGPFFRKRRTLVLTRQLSPPTLKSDEIRFRKLLPTFHGRPLSRISSNEVDEFLDSLILHGRSPATRNRYRALLHTYLKHAMRVGVVKKNVVTEIPILSERLKTRPVDYWRTTKERDAYISGARTISTVYGVGASILCLGGCRVSEALALQWGDIEWERDYIRIRRIIERHTGLPCDRTKGQRAGGEYQMILTPRLRRVLRKWKSAAFSVENEAFILRSETVKHFTYDQWRRVHEKAITLSGVKRITLHDIRRTFACHAERAGFHRAEIGELLGHETLSATEAYTLVDVSHLVEKAKRLKFGD